LRSRSSTRSARIQPAAPHLPSGDRAGGFPADTRTPRPGNVLVRLDADVADRRNRCGGDRRHDPREAGCNGAIAFGAIVAIGYLVVYTLALSFYDRATVELEFLKSRWYSAIAALVIAALISYLLPAKWNQRFGPVGSPPSPSGRWPSGLLLSPYFTR